MNKIKLLTVKKFENHMVYVLEKDQEFFSACRSFLEDLGFEDIEIDFFGRVVDENGEPIKTQEDDITTYVDKHYYFQSNKGRVDVVFGKDKIFLVVYSSKTDSQEEIALLLSKICTFDGNIQQ